MLWILAANIIGGSGSALSLFAHYYLGKGEFAKSTGFKCHIVSSTLIFTSALMLGSIPVMMLNALWLLISYAGYMEFSLSAFSSKMLRPVNGILFVLSLVSLILGEYTWAATLAMWVYVCGYVLFSSKDASARYYYGWCVVAFAFTVPHLLETYQYSVLTAETIGCAISIQVFALSFQRVNRTNESLKEADI